MEGENDAVLLARAAKGETDAFRKLFEAHHAAMFRFAYRVTNALDVAEDLTHECFVRLMRRPMFDHERGSLRQYLYGILRNLIRQHLRVSGREVNWGDNAEDDLHFAIQAAPASIASAELSAVVQAALSTLPPLQREAIVLCEFEELSLNEAAAIVGVDIGALKARLHRAREGLRLRLAPYRSYVRVSATKKE